MFPGIKRDLIQMGWNMLEQLRELTELSSTFRTQNGRCSPYCTSECQAAAQSVGHTVSLILAQMASTAICKSRVWRFSTLSLLLAIYKVEATVRSKEPLDETKEVLLKGATLFEKAFQLKETLNRDVVEEAKEDLWQDFVPQFWKTLSNRIFWNVMGNMTAGNSTVDEVIEMHFPNMSQPMKRLQNHWATKSPEEVREAENQLTKWWDAWTEQLYRKEPMSPDERQNLRSLPEGIVPEDLQDVATQFVDYSLMKLEQFIQNRSEHIQQVEDHVKGFNDAFEGFWQELWPHVALLIEPYRPFFGVVADLIYYFLIVLLYIFKILFKLFVVNIWCVPLIFIGGPCYIIWELWETRGSGSFSWTDLQVFLLICAALLFWFCLVCAALIYIGPTALVFEYGLPWAKSLLQIIWC